MAITLRALLVVAAAVVVALAGRAVLGRFVRAEWAVKARPTAEIIMEAMAALYGVLVAFLLAGAWERFDEARAAMTLEANAIAELEQVARFLPAPAGEDLGAAAEAYRESALEELPLLAEGRSSRKVAAIVDRLWSILARFEPATPGQAGLQARAFESVAELESQRRIRVLGGGRTLPPILWLVLVGGAAAVLAVAAISSLGGRLPAACFALLAGLISLALYVMNALAYPMRSGLATELAPFLEHLPGRLPPHR
ncbi:MAG TPA: DUF4239 domain-containing protein [Longimicrobiales bacterium]